jgi:hypothetical protein
MESRVQRRVVINGYFDMVQNGRLKRSTPSLIGVWRQGSR